MTQKLRIVVCGATGRMGQAVIRAAGAGVCDVEITAGVGEHADQSGTVPIVTTANAGDAIANADAIIDFSAPAATTALLHTNRDALKGKAVVIGTTGLSAEDEQVIADAATRAAVVTAANFSVGVNLLLDLVTRAARVLGQEYDIEIVEAHHRNKVDAPSGTALALARAAASGRNVKLEDVRRDGRSGETGKRPSGEIGLHAVRGGAVVGEHDVQFLGDTERIILSHVASDRALFAEGAIKAALWARAKAPGRYTMRDVLGLED